MRHGSWTILLLVAFGCANGDERQHDEKTAAISAAPSTTLAECFGMFAAAVHGACEEAGGSDCVTDGLFDGVSADRDLALRNCMSTRSDVQPCSSLLTEGCPPGLSDAECTAARGKAVAACETN